MKHLLVFVAFEIIATVIATPALTFEPLSLIGTIRSNGLRMVSRTSQVTQNNNRHQEPIENKVKSEIQGEKGKSKPSRVVVQENPTVYYNDASPIETAISGNQKLSKSQETDAKSDDHQENSFNIPTIEVEPCRCDKMLMKMITTGDPNPEFHPPKMRVKN